MWSKPFLQEIPGQFGSISDSGPGIGSSSSYIPTALSFFSRNFPLQRFGEC